MCYCFYNDMERPITSTVSHGGGTAVRLAANTYDELGSLASRQVDGEGGWHYYIKDYQGNVRAVIEEQGALEEVNNYYPYGALLGSGTVGGNAGVQPYKYGAKELDRQNGLDWYDFEARTYDYLIGQFNSMDALSEKKPRNSPFTYCSGNPINRIDPTGRKDTTFVNGVDKPITIIPGTATYFDLDENGNPIKGANTSNAYNCHSYAWDNSEGDPEDPANASLVSIGATKWDNDPSNNMGDYDQLDSNEPNKTDDRVIYYYDANNDGRYNPGEPIDHSAVVLNVDSQGYTTIVIGKMGQQEISTNHPNAPNYYQDHYEFRYGMPYKVGKTSRAYFRKNNGKSK